MDLSIIIVNYNQKNLLKQCWQNIINAQIKLNFELIVVDNNSSDGTRDLLSDIKNEPAIKPQIILNAVNLGFAKAVNQGLKQSIGQYVLVLNPDIIILPGSVEKLHQFIKSHGRCAIAAPKLLNPDKTLQFSAYRFPKWYMPILRRTFLGRFGWGKKQIDYYLMKDWDHQENREVDWVLGGAMMLNRLAVEQIGGLDERFFLYFEDVELCRRVKKNNWQVWYVAEAPFYHYHQRLSAEPLGLFKKITWIHASSWLKYLLKR
ncbi:MAG: glycosyltransferase family 2 protein [Patescibacteria group bacterium]|nr:glycosyltransferase family 2 protein [Patescibacteria group bacterium]MDD5121428.1 glycosyltransferase family 2 protein [Patescibacteria group bacterium]MDD5221886.1 glycosyltransferase family 2 protein [Patescibacteria group bacterium]MDD5395653.1 glycosyltransferase family 2 protein [Patescibacteria group bacterium]